MSLVRGFQLMAGRMRWAEGFIAVDWGTTNRRAYLLDGRGECAQEFEDGKGILSVPAGGFGQAVEEIRARLGDKPLLLAGMIGSNRGWIEAPYVSCPAGLGDLVLGLVWAEARVAIVPGVSQLAPASDVMRGEEVQILGAAAGGLIPSSCLVCHPGTHNKWVRMESGRIAEFRTVMTGELFNLLKQHSILADLLSGTVAPDNAFRSGVRQGVEKDDVQAELFSVRARVLLGQAPSEEAASYTSGLLIGSDVRIGLTGSRDRQVLVMGRPELTSLYAAALTEAGREAVEVDGERAFLSGIAKLAEAILT